MNKHISRIKNAVLRLQYKGLVIAWNFLRNNIFEIEVFILIAFVLGLYTRIPYINLFISPTIYYLVLTGIAIKLFMFNTRQIIILVLFAFGVLTWFSFQHQEVLAELLSNCIYAVLCYLCVRKIYELKNEL